MSVLSNLIFYIVISRSLAIYTYTFVPEYTTIPTMPYPQWQLPQNNRLLYHSFVTTPIYGQATPAQLMRAPMNYLPAGFQYTTYPSLQYYSPTIEDPKTVNSYPSVQTQKLRTIPSDEEVNSQETTDELPAADSTLFYQELLRAQLYRQLQEIKKAYRLRKAFEKVNSV